jgi:hypothetical protein
MKFQGNTEITPQKSVITTERLVDLRAEKEKFGIDR